MKRYVIAVGSSPLELQKEIDELLEIEPSYIPAGGICKVSNDAYIQAMFLPLSARPTQLDYRRPKILADILPHPSGIRADPPASA